MQRIFLQHLALMVCLAGLAAPQQAFGQASSARPPAPADAAPAEQPEPQLDPANSLLVVEPKTPAELFDATVRMVDVKRLDLARYYFEQFTALQADAPTLVALRTEFGVAPFMRLTQVPELRDPAMALLDAASAALVAHLRDPDVLRALLNRLGGKPAERALALAEIRALGAEAVPALLTALSAGAPDPMQQAAREALRMVGGAASGQLQAALDAPDEATRVAAMSVLGKLGSSASLPHLWSAALLAGAESDEGRAARAAISQILGRGSRGGGDAYSAADLRARLVAAARRHLRHEHPWTLEPDGKVVLWSWNPNDGTVTSQRVSPGQASDAVGARFARAAAAAPVSQPSGHARALALAFNLLAGQPHASANRGDSPVAGADTQTLAGAAHELLAARRSGAAAGCLRLLAGRGDRDAEVMAVALAGLIDPHASVQFEAASLLARLAPAEPMRGSSRVKEVLQRAAASGSARRAVVAEVSAERGGSVAGYLAELGFTAELVTTGRQAFIKASERTDVELVVLHPNIIRWPLSETLANLRADARTRLIPVVIHGPADLRNRMELVEQRVPRVVFASLAQSTQDFEWQIQEALQWIPESCVSPRERASQREVAVELLQSLSERSRR